jgi:3-dehydroquinate synthase
VIEAKAIHVAAGDVGYDVLIAPGLIGEVGERLRPVTSARRVAIVSDTNVDELFGVAVATRLVSAGFDVLPMAFAPGEVSKSWAVAGELLEGFAKVGLGREDLVVALGGGVVGDLAGFAAATYLRGIEFAQVPTTLLAQVDSSVGGKTGVDLRAGKNLAGAFKQPVIVIADTDVVSSLSPSEWASGSAEIAKSAVIESEEFTAWLEVESTLLAARDSRTVTEAVQRSVAFKAAVVSTDEKEAGERECLNYGHTFGHALESVAGYGAIPHGVAVAEGMRFAARLAAQVAGASRDFVRRQDGILDRLDLPAMTSSFSASRLLDAMHADKKARRGTVRFVLATEPGAWGCQPVADDVIAEHLDAWSASKKETR